MVLNIIKNKINAKTGYYEITLDNRDSLFLTRSQYMDMKELEKHNLLMFKSTNGKFYKPTSLDGYVQFINV